MNEDLAIIKNLNFNLKYADIIKLAHTSVNSVFLRELRVKSWNFLKER